MKKEDIEILDLYRILHGQVPLEFYFELIIRALFVFVVLTFGMKYMGKRLTSQITRSELAATSTLAAATGLIILAPDRGLVPPLIIVAIIIIIIQRFIHKRSMHHDQFEFATEGHLRILVRDGMLDLKAMGKERVSKAQVFAELRNNNIIHLGEVYRLYLEASGDFTVIKDPAEKNGLAVIPAWDKELLQELAIPDSEVCSDCGATKVGDSKICSNCGNHEWTAAIRKL